MIERTLAFLFGVASLLTVLAALWRSTGSL